jgi:uncharacterized protein YaeQ
MALTATVHRFALEVSDVDRGVYESLALQVARHPSETVEYMALRVLAFALEHREDLTFGRGIGAPDEPTISVRDPHGRVGLWIDVGAPSAERLHKVSKLADEVVVYTNRKLPALRQAWSGTAIHRAESIRVVAVDAALLAELAAIVDRRNDWQVLRTEGTLYVTHGGGTASGQVVESTVG